VNDRRDCVEEGERILARQAAHRIGERRRGERAGSDDDIVPVLRRQSGDFAALDGDERIRLERLGDRRREAVAVDGERAAGRHLVAVAHRHDERIRHAHLGMQEADGIRLGIVGTEGVGADQLGEAVGLVGIGGADGPHLVQHDRNAAPGDLPGGFRAGKSAADDMDGAERARGKIVRRHGADIRAGAGWRQPARRQRKKRPPGRRSAGVSQKGRRRGEEVAGRLITETREEVRRREAEFSVTGNRLAGDLVDIGTVDAEVGEFTLGQAGQLVLRLAILEPGLVAVDEVHGGHPSI